MPESRQEKNPISAALFALIIAGEAIFVLPFVLTRVFRPTVLEVFDLSNLELGLIFSVYGIIAVFSYLFGGPIADKFPARNLISLALVSTALGGLFLATIPDYIGMKWLFGFWGFTTIFLFWAALIKATRELGGEKMQGIAFGFLDSGRGLVSALIGSLTVLVFSFYLPIDPEFANLAEKTKALESVIYFIITFIVLVAIAVFFILPSSNKKLESTKPLTFQAVLPLLSSPTIWLQAIIIICAYVGYKSLSDFSLYAKDVLLFDDLDAAKVGSLMLWTRPIAALAAGFLAFKFNPVKLIIISFAAMAIGSIHFAQGYITVDQNSVFYLSMITICSGVFALRALYFAILKDAKVPLALTGTAVGFISLIGYTPDIFMGPLMGWLLDRNPGILGHQHLYFVLFLFALMGILASILFQRLSNRVN